MRCAPRETWKRCSVGNAAGKALKAAASSGSLEAGRSGAKHAAAEAQGEVESRVFMDAIVCQCAATLELPADQQEPTELTLFGLKKSALDPSLVGFQDLEIRHGASEQVNDSLLTLFFNSSSTCVSPTRW